MHNIEPFFRWRDEYISERDPKSPFFGREYSEFEFTDTIYNYLIHPQWDSFGSENLYLKILFADYDEGITIIEMIGEWNDCINNDIMILKRNIIEPMIFNGISKFIIIVENVLNFFGSDDCYYEEWHEESLAEDGWIVFINTLEHVAVELEEHLIHHHIIFGEDFSNISWRPFKPNHVCEFIKEKIERRTKGIYY